MSWIKRLLGITELENKVQELNAQVLKLRQDRNIIRLDLLNAEDKIKNLQALVQVGVDVHMYHGTSWAVVCIAGNPEYVQFVDLGKQEARVIKDFLRQFDRKNVCVDTPPHMRLFFDEDKIKRKSP